MKKLNKLLIPVVGLSTIVATVAPMTACNKGGNTPVTPETEGVQVTETEWNDAMSYLSSKTAGSTWKSDSEDVIEAFQFDQTGALEQFVEYYNIAFNDDLGTASCVHNDGDDTGIYKISTVKRNSLFYQHDEDVESGESKDNVMNYGFVQDALTEIIGDLGGQPAYTWKEESKSYAFVGKGTVGEQPCIATSKVKFNSKKQIIYVNCHAFVLNSDQTLIDRISNVELHPIYDNVTVDVDSKIIERADAHLFALPESKTLTVNTLDKTVDHDVIGINISNMSVASNTKLTAAVSSGVTEIINGVVLFKGDKKLSQGSDYIFDYTMNQITFVKAIESTESVCVTLTFNKMAALSQPVTITLAK